MSMTIYLVKLPAAVAERVQADPELLGQVWEEVEVTDPDVAGLHPDDLLMQDYLGLGRTVDEDPDRYPWMLQALQGSGQEIDFEYGYGPGFLLTAPEIAQLVAGLADEGWWRPGEPVETIGQAITAFYHSAGRDGRSVIGGVG